MPFEVAVIEKTGSLGGSIYIHLRGKDVFDDNGADVLHHLLSVDLDILIHPQLHFSFFLCLLDVSQSYGICLFYLALLLNFFYCQASTMRSVAFLASVVEQLSLEEGTTLVTVVFLLVGIVHHVPLGDELTSRHLLIHLTLFYAWAKIEDLISIHLLRTSSLVVVVIHAFIEALSQN